MPGMDGWQTLRSVRRLYGEREVPKLVMLSGQGRELLSQRTSREQELLNAFLVKPLTPAMFTAALNPAHDATASSLRADDRDAMLRLGGMRLLVVEDNLINQQVAMELLSAEGALVTLADNGKLGVDAVAAAEPPFDVVLMDLQMPVMDGMAAARAIRQNPAAAALPIIAMTANAMASDREACLEAGMNDHVGKPFDLDDLVDVLVRHTGWKPRPPEGQPQQPNAVVPAGNLVPTIDWPAGIDGASALARMGGNVGLLQRTMQSYLRDAARLPDLVATHMAAGDREAAVRELHSFKGLSATLGVQALATLAAQAESLAKSPDQHAAWVACMENIRGSIGENLPVLENLAGRLQAPKAPVARAGQVLLLPLTALLEVLRASDMVAMELHAALVRPDDVALEAALAPLDAAMADLDFDAAATACEALIHHLQS
jgi:CheY-like chemotaxis protein